LKTYNVRKISSPSYICPKLTHAQQSHGLFATAKVLVALGSMHVSSVLPSVDIATETMTDFEYAEVA